MAKCGTWLAGFCCLMLGAVAARAQSLRLGVPFPQDSQEWKAAAEASAEIARATDNRVKIVLSAPDLQAGTAGRIARGVLDGGLITGTDATELELGPDAMAYAVPFSLTSAEQVDFVRRRLDGEVLARLSAGPYEALAISGFGFAHVMSCKPLSSPADWRTLRIWMPIEGEGWLAQMLKDLGLQAVRLPANKVREGLNTGTVDTLILPPAGAILKRWHTRLKVCFDVPYAYTYGIWVVRDAAVDKLTAADRKLVREHLTGRLEQIARQRRQSALDVLRKWRLEFVTPDAVMQAQWNRWSVAVWDILGPKLRPSESLEALLKEQLQAFTDQQERKAVPPRTRPEGTP